MFSFSFSAFRSDHFKTQKVEWFRNYAPTLYISAGFFCKMHFGIIIVLNL